MVPAAPEVLQVAEAIHRAFALDDHSLSEAFRPAHLAVALIDAVFAASLKPGRDTGARGGALLPALRPLRARARV